MLYTKNGDKGQTKIFHCNQSFSKSSVIAEALGTLDEVNSFLGVVKAKSDQESGQGNSSALGGISLTALIQEVQENLFIIQAQVAGAEKSIAEEKILAMEEKIDNIEKELPPIKSFFISGATEMSALLDFARTLVRRAERRVVAVKEENLIAISAETLVYLNRLSSLFYALARQEAHKSGIKEASPLYQ